MCEHRYVEKEIDTRDRAIDREEKENNNSSFLSESDPGEELRKRVAESMKRIEQRRAANG